jgi:hypothetical protein
MKGNVTKTGYWPDSPDRNNDFNIIPSNNITMEGMDMPLMGVSDKGDKKLMIPGKNYKFKGKSVMETPVDKGMYLGHFQFKNGGLVRMEPGGPVNPNFKPSYDWKKSPEENAELNKRAEAAGHNSVAEYEKSGWAWQPEKTHFTQGEGQGIRKAEPKQQSYYDKNLSVQHVVDEAKRAAPAIAENQNKSKYKMYDPKNKYANLYDEDAAGLPSVPIFESLLMAPVALGSAGLAGLGEATYAAGAASPFLQATGAALGSSPAWAPGLSIGNTMAAADLAYVGNQVLDSDSDLRQSVNVAIDNPNTDNIINAVANVGLAGLDVLGAGVIGDIGKGSKSFKGLPNSTSAPTNEFNTKGAIGDLFKRKNFEEAPSLIKPSEDPEALSVLSNLKKRIATPEGQERLKNLGIDDPSHLHNMKIVENPDTYGSYQYDGNIEVHPDHKPPLKKQITRHEVEHGVGDTVQRNKIKKGKKWYDVFTGSDRQREADIYSDPRTEIDKSLEDLDLELEPRNIDWDAKKQNKKKEDVDLDKFGELIGDNQNATDYFASGSGGNEKSAFLSEAQQYMMDNGDIPKDSYVDISPEMVKKVYERAKTDEAGGGKYLRIFNIMKPNEKNFKLISDNLNKMLAVPAAAIVGDQIIGNQPAQEKKKGGGIYLGAYKQVGGQLIPHDISVPNLSRQDGGDMPFGLPLKEQNIYTLPEYNQPRNPKTGEILPDPQRPNLGMDTNATEYKYTYGMDEGDVDVPSIVAGQYIGDQALDRYMLTGDRFKTMADPSSYSKFYDTIGQLGLMQEKQGGSVKRVKIKSLPNNWKSQ